MINQQYRHLATLFYVLAIIVRLKFGCGSIDKGYPGRSCVGNEKQALLQFKRGLFVEFNYLSSWNGDDCCSWYGVACNNKSTSHVTKVDLRNCSLRGDQILCPSLLDLKYLTHLDLSFNHFDNIQIPEFFGAFKNLVYLNLSYSKFKGFVPRHLGNLSSLRYLDLNYNLDRNYYSLLSVDSFGWLSNLRLLEHLDLSYVNLSRATDWFPTINMFPDSFLVLKLSGCQLPNNIPSHLPSANLTSLVTLDLSYNQFISSFPSWIFNNTGLTHLDLSLNSFNGPIPDSIGSLASLSKLSLSGNKFEGLIPQSIRNLASLSTLILSYNRLSNLIPREIGNLTELETLGLNSNDLEGRLPETMCQLSKLETLYVPYNRLSGSIPKCIGKLSNLFILDLSSNSWEGVISEDHFLNLTRLTHLIVSSKSNLALNVSSKWDPPFQLIEIFMETLKVGPKFPHWLLKQRQIMNIILSNTSISDTISAGWFASVLSSQASFVDISNNDINGEMSLVSSAPNGVQTLQLSYNRLSGDFPAFLCNLTSLTTLVLSNNNFSGELPQCIENLTGLKDFDVMNYSLSGDIPAPLGSLRNLTYSNLHNNKFRGKLPSTFQNLTRLVVLDVGKNNLRDVLPSWTKEDLPRLRYLILRSNNFYGNIPTKICHHSSIQVLNLAQNEINGSIPPCFGNFSAMIISNSSEEDLYLALDFPGFRLVERKMIIDDGKGYEQKYTSIPLWHLFSIDLSDNKITGEIPENLMDLHGLLNLNLAGNYLYGRIPDRIGELEKLQFLDLSRNELYGPIPQSLSDINFLSHLNLSFNDLSGRIPTGHQLQTLNDPSTYAGNNKLCGQPIQKPCSSDTGSHNVPDNKEADSDDDDERVWIYAGIGPGLFVGFLGFFTSLHFISSWRY